MDMVKPMHSPLQHLNYKIRITKKHLRWGNTGIVLSNNEHQMCVTAREELFEILSFIWQLELRCAV